MLLLALLSALALPFLLPKMHERYYFLADALALALVLAEPTRRNLVIAGAVQLASLSAIVGYMYFYWNPWPALAGAFVAAAALAMVWREARAKASSLSTV